MYVCMLGKHVHMFCRYKRATFTPAYTFILSIDIIQVVETLCFALYCVVFVDLSPAI